MADLFTPEDLTGQPGASSVTEEIARSVGDQIRRLCGWHIAPEITETLTLDSDGARTLMLPSLHVTDVTSVRDVTGSEPRELTGWRWSKNGMIELPAGFPRGFRAVEVDISHGYETCPPELFPVAADFSRRRVAQESIGGRSVSFVSAADGRLDSILSAFKIFGRP